MVQALILAGNYHEYRFFIRHFDLNPHDYRYITELNDVCGWWVDKPVILVEGYERNQNYTLQLMNYIGHRFDNIGFLSEGEMD